MGSIIRVPATGKLIVGAWNPKSISRLATSSTVTPVCLVIGAEIDDALVGDPPVLARVQHREGGVRRVAT